MEGNHSSQSNRMRIFLLFFSVTLANFYFYIGFAVKPYMLFSLLFVLIHLTKFYFHRLQIFEVGMLLFYLSYMYTGTFALYPSASLRIIFGIIIYITCYFIMKVMIGDADDKDIDKAIGDVGIVFNASSLILYVLGLQAFQFLFEGDGISKFGVLMDRNYPRLIGLLQDPNFFIFYNTIFISYFLCNSNTLKNKVGLLLSLLTTFLTFSRGGLLAVISIFLVFMLMNNLAKNIKFLITGLLTFSCIAYISVVMLKFDAIGILNSRVQDFSSDGGSGRFTLWARAWDYFEGHILVGLGAFNFSSYNFYNFGDTQTVHNTYLDILSESGLIGITSFCFFLLLVIYQLFKHNIHREKPYLFITFIAYLLQFASLSVIINDMFFLYMAILATYLHKLQFSQNRYTRRYPKPILKPLIYSR
ncbi:O-antigen ligase family protein [Bacillus sp. 2205SS5-2]|uniref:O-antigen ligase family protein n=1 Tax=Bacillus sp. 2205SS5-2 TaxID=3109031 RepID=UPI003003E2B6